MEYSQIVSQKINNHILKITDETSCTEAEQDLIAFVLEYLSSIPNSVHSEEDWIEQLLKYQEDDLYVPYIGNAITFCWHVNPIRLLSLANRDHFPLLFPFFEHSVSIVPQMDSSVFFSLLEEIYGKLDHNYLKTRVAVSIASYFQDKPIEHICSFYRETYINCSEAKTWLTPFVAKHYAAIGPTQFQNSVVQFLQSDNLNLKQAAIDSCIRILTQFFVLVKNVVPIIMNQVKGKTFSFERAQLVDSSISLLYQFNNIERTDNSEQVILEALSDSHTHQVTYSEFVFSLFEHLSASAFHPNEFEMQCLYSLVLSNHSANGNTQLLIDDIIFHMIQNGCFEQSWRLLKSASVNYQIEDLYSSTITALFQNIKYFLPYIYTDIEGSTSLNTIGLSLISKYSFSHENQFHLDFWADNLFTHNVTRIAQKIFVCNASAEFVCSWGVTVLMHESQYNQKSIVDLFRDQVCDNYPHIARTIIGRAISDASENFPTLNELQNHCNTVIDAIETISKTKDFIPPLDQLQAYRSAHHKFEQKIMQDSHKKSIFYNMFHTQTIKYGVRTSFIQHASDSSYLQESPHASIKMELALPRIFHTDPLFHFNCLTDALKEDSEE